MEIQIVFDAEVAIECSVCGSDLDAKHNPRGNLIRVDPCETCTLDPPKKSEDIWLRRIVR